MIGANEFTADDLHWNSVYVGSLQGRDDFLARCKRLGFSVQGNQVLAPKAEIESAMARRLITDSPELQARFDEAGTTAEINSRGQVAVTNWPEGKWSGGPSFLRDMAASLDAQIAAEACPCCGWPKGDHTSEAKHRISHDPAQDHFPMNAQRDGYSETLLSCTQKHSA